MDKNAIKKYAVWARNELIERVSQKALQYGVTADGKADPKDTSVNGKLLSETEIKQREALIRKVNEQGYKQTMEEVAYTWFNRFAALRFMEVNGYLPSHVRVFTNDEGEFKPQILSEAIHLELDGLNMDNVYELKNANKNEELFKYLLITQCNAFSGILPKMFQKIADYTELLLPDYLLREGSVIQQMIEIIAEDDWKDQVEIIGWLYQFYISEPKDELINARKKYSKSEIPFVTQLFTSDWIVKFMVQNSLGRYWIENGGSKEIINDWEFYLKQHEEDLNQKSLMLKPENILCLDPCMGSGHILVYLFDVLVKIYESYGYSAREAAPLIVEKNIWGLDIDERASQLAYFSVMMKARQYDRRFFNHIVQPNIYCIEESNNIQKETIEMFCANNISVRRNIEIVLNNMKNAKEYGSIINPDSVDYSILYNRLTEISEDRTLFSDVIYDELMPLIKVSEVLSNTYDIVVTNPPYMNSSYMPAGLKDYVQKYYSDFKGDLFAVFSERVIALCKHDGHVGLLMPYVWMFIASYEKMRQWINANTNITALVQLEYNAFEAACVPVATLTMKKTNIHTEGEYVKLSDFRGSDNQAPKTIEAVKNPNCGYRFSASQDGFEKIPGNLIAYWASEQLIDSFEKPSLGTILTTREGMATAGNDDFLRLWYEIPRKNIGWGMHDSEEAKNSRCRWFPYNKGGDYRKWYGNNDYLVNWENDGALIRNNKDPKTGRIRSHNYNGNFAFKRGITWSALSSSSISVRYADYGFLFDSKGAKGFAKSEEDLLVSLALINSKVGLTYLSFISPTIDFKVGDVIQIPLLDGDYSKIIALAQQCVDISREDWDSFETSWDFKRHPLVRGSKVKDAFAAWEEECSDRFSKLKALEEEINRVLIDIYGISDLIDPKVEDKDISIRKADLQRDIKGLISYAVGCIFGRYSLQREGIVCDEPTKIEQNTLFEVDRDNIVPISDDEYFEDDIVGRFTKFVEIAYGKEHLEENLQFIADTLGGSGTSRERIRNYFLNGFYSDHCNMYSVTGSGKRPIYWLFDSGKKNGFKCLIYIHRYQPDTIARIRTDYVHEQQARYRTAIDELEKQANNVSTADRVKLNKKLTSLKAQADELRTYEEKVHHLADQMIIIDVNDGVKSNYELFTDILAKVK